FEEGGAFTDHGYIVDNRSKFIEQYNGNREEIPDEYRVFTPNEPEEELLPPIDEQLANMSENEKQGLINGIEMALDYGIADDIPQSDMDLYNAVIQERSEQKPS